MDTITVVKISGRELDDTAFLEQFCRALAALERPCVLVHGGGKEISAALERYGQPVRFVDGLRVTPPESMAVMEMVACGSINKRLVARLVAAGKPALGLSGVDLGVLRCVPYRPGGVDLERVGVISSVDIQAIHTFLDNGWLPVFAPVALGQDDNLPYNVNADMVAQGIAAALSQSHSNIASTEGEAKAETETELVFVSNVPGVILAGEVAPLLTTTEIAQGIQSGAITNGMIPKVQAALDAIAAGVVSTRITNLEGLADGGTHIIR